VIKQEEPVEQSGDKSYLSGFKGMFKRIIKETVNLGNVTTEEISKADTSINV
jgi:hypothetical protein